MHIFRESCDMEFSPTPKQVQCSEDKNHKEPRQPFLKCRHIVVFVGFWLFLLISGYRLNMSVSIVAMVNNSALSRHTTVESESCTLPLSNLSVPDIFGTSREDGEFEWSPTMQGYVLGSYFLGYEITQIPGGRMAERFGFKWLLFGSSLVTALSTLLVPVLSWASVYALIAVQLLRGLAQGVIEPASTLVAATWFPRSERGLLYTIMQSGACLGGCLGSLLAGLLCASIGRWASSFYTFGAVGLFASVLVLMFLFETPKSHPKISKAELDFILSDLELSLTEKRPSPPWGEMLTSVPVYALMFGCFGQMWAISQFLIVYPIFLGTILHYPIGQNGSIVALSFLLQFVLAQSGGWLSSLMMKRKVASIDFVRKFWNFISCLGFSTCLIGVYAAGCDRLLNMIFAVLSMGFTGYGYAGVWLVAADMSPTFAGVLNGICHTCSCFSSVILPLLVGWLTDEMQTLEQWNKVFFISICVVMSSGIIYGIFGSADVQSWNCGKKVADQMNDRF